MYLKAHFKCLSLHKAFLTPPAERKLSSFPKSGVCACPRAPVRLYFDFQLTCLSPLPAPSCFQVEGVSLRLWVQVMDSNPGSGVTLAKSLKVHMPQCSLLENGTDNLSFTGCCESDRWCMHRVRRGAGTRLIVAFRSLHHMRLCAACVQKQ